jgi:DMSO/TMAO reductase YedYZ molybdopterin-dependent catalytic subunit
VNRSTVVICNDDFTESIDMASALHPQTILASKYAGALLADPFGYPLRLRTTVKLGYKNAKWIRAIEGPINLYTIRPSRPTRKLSGTP